MRCSTLFRKVFSLLKPGGVFLLEPQPWASYKKKYNLNETTRRNFHAITMRPNGFVDCLLHEVGFRSVRMLPPPRNKNKGFERPIFAFTR